MSMVSVTDLRSAKQLSTATWESLSPEDRRYVHSLLGSMYRYYNDLATHTAFANGRIEQLRGNLSLAEEGLANYAQESEQLRSTLAHRLQELYEARWLIRNGEKHFGSLWRDATTDDILAITRRAEPQTEKHT